MDSMRTVRTPRGLHEESMETRGGVSNTACLVEFQTPTIFVSEHDFVHSTFDRLPKIMKLIIWTLYIHEKLLLFPFEEFQSVSPAM